MKLLKNIFIYGPLYFHTIRHLKTKQIFFRVLRSLNLQKKTDIAVTHNGIRKSPRSWIKSISKKVFIPEDNNFLFLNLLQTVDSKSDWNNKNYTKLWLYNLHYFDYINSHESNSFNKEKEIIKSWIADNPPFYGVGWDPYPSSIRIVNWIKWLYENNYSNKEIEDSIFLQSKHLFNNIEYHILGNHLFSNAKALIFAGLFFKGQESKVWLSKARSILKKELSEQILPDGGHYELSPMYHSIILEDILDLHNIFNCHKKNLNHELVESISKMFKWLESMTHPDNKISFFNDSAHGIANSLKDLEIYRRRLKIKPHLEKNNLYFNDFKHSGYSSILQKDIFLVVDRGNVGPSYLPGHAHADTLSFELSIYKNRFIVNLGTSLYEDGVERLKQRGTANHSTLLINDANSSNVWSSFRVAQRAKIVSRSNHINDDLIEISGMHDGYSRLKGRLFHERTWKVLDDKIEIIDLIKGKGTQDLKLIFPLHPDVIISGLNDNMVNCKLNEKEVSISFLSEGMVKVKNCNYHPYFGVSIPSKKIIYEELRTLPITLKTVISW
jgi:uncharacterized heparinase superfamily protein